MVNTKGYRRGTRYLFARDFRRHGTEHISTYLKIYKRGDYVDIKGNGAFHKGMPHKYYHGKTGKVFNVTPRGVGVIVNKRVRHRIIRKRICVRVEHIKPSNCTKEFRERLKRNEALKKMAKEKGIYIRGRDPIAIKEAKAKGIWLNFKREAKGPREAHFVRAKDNEPQYLEPIPYEFIA